MSEWGIHHFGRDPELDKIVMRRGGPAPECDFPCQKPEIIICAMWECQKENRCAAAKAFVRKIA